jgi:hypothetical protein
VFNENNLLSLSLQNFLQVMMSKAKHLKLARRDSSVAKNAPLRNCCCEERSDKTVHSDAWIASLENARNDMDGFLLERRAPCAVGNSIRSDLNCSEKNEKEQFNFGFGIANFGRLQISQRLWNPPYPPLLRGESNADAAEDSPHMDPLPESVNAYIIKVQQVCNTHIGGRG